MTQVDAAHRIGVSSEFYARIERGNALPSLPTFARLAAALSVSSDTLLGLSEPEERLPDWARELSERPELRRLVRRLRSASPGVLRAMHMLVKELERGRNGGTELEGDESEDEGVLDEPGDGDEPGDDDGAPMRNNLAGCRNRSMTIRIAVERERDRVILDKIIRDKQRTLRGQGPAIAFFVGDGWSCAESFARTVLDTTRDRVALVVDADGFRSEHVAAQQRFLESSLSAIAHPRRWLVLLIVPELESVFFEHRAVRDELFGTAISIESEIQARCEPREVLGRLLPDSRLPEGLAKRLAAIDCARLADLPLLRPLIDFVLAEPSTAESMAPE